MHAEPWWIIGVDELVSRIDGGLLPVRCSEGAPTAVAAVLGIDASKLADTSNLLRVPGDPGMG